MFNKSIISRKKVLYKKYYVKIERLTVFKKNHYPYQNKKERLHELLIMLRKACS